MHYLKTQHQLLAESYDVSAILASCSGLPVTQVQVSDLQWALAHGTAAPAGVLDLSSPLYVGSVNHQLVTFVGLERLAYAVQVGVKSLPCRIIPKDMLPRFITA